MKNNISEYTICFHGGTLKSENNNVFFLLNFKFPLSLCNCLLHLKLLKLQRHDKKNNSNPPPKKSLMLFTLPYFPYLSIA